MAFNNTKVCTHLTLGKCRCTNYRKLCQKAQIDERKKEYNAEKRWGYFMDLMLNDDPWKIKKVLRESDLSNMNRLMLGREVVNNFFLPMLGTDAEIEKGVAVKIWDVDTYTVHSLIFKRWVSSRCYVFIGKWVQDFVKRRDLKIGDEIRLLWDPYNNYFDFSVLRAN